jgi:hypothetical protein
MKSKLEISSEIVQALAWPAIALIGIILFYSPIHTTLTGISDHANDINEVKLGSLEMTIQASALPHPSRAVASALVGLPQEEFVMMLDIGRSSHGMGYCVGADPIYYQKGLKQPLDDLQKRGLISLEPMKKSVTNCEGDYAELTSVGKEANLFVVTLVTTQFKSASVK